MAPRFKKFEIPISNGPQFSIRNHLDRSSQKLSTVRSHHHPLFSQCRFPLLPESPISNPSHPPFLSFPSEHSQPFPSTISCPNFSPSPHQNPRFHFLPTISLSLKLSQSFAHNAVHIGHGVRNQEPVRVP